MKIYIATSWRNERKQQFFVTVLRDAGYEVYDFIHPEPGKSGFRWKELGVRVAEYVLGDEKEWRVDTYLKALGTPRAQEGFKSDMDALKNCDVCVLVQPCGNSAHLELGWAAGAGKLTAIMLEESPKAELMVLMADKLFFNVTTLMEWLENEPIPCRAGKGWGPCACKSCEADRAIDP